MVIVLGWCSWACMPLAAARHPRPPGPYVGVAAAPLLGRPVRARLDALHRPDARPPSTPWPTTRRDARCAAAARVRLLPRARASPSSSPPWRSAGWCGAARLRPPPPGGVMRLGRRDAGRRRSAARHRCLGLTMARLDATAGGSGCHHRGLSIDQVRRGRAPEAGASTRPGRDPPEPARRRRWRRSSSCGGRGASSPRCGRRWCCCSCSPSRRSPVRCIPQRATRPPGRRVLHASHPTLAPVFDRLGPVRRLQLAVVPRDLPAAVHLAARLHHPAAAALSEVVARARRRRRRATWPGCRRTTPVDRHDGRRGGGSGPVPCCAASDGASRSMTRASDPGSAPSSAPRRATCGRRAT